MTSITSAYFATNLNATFIHSFIQSPSFLANSAMANRSRQPKNNLEDMRRVVAEKFPHITSLRSSQNGTRTNNNKENRPPGTTSNMELVVLSAPKAYEFGIRSNDVIYMPNTTTAVVSPPLPAMRQVQ